MKMSKPDNPEYIHACLEKVSDIGARCLADFAVIAVVLITFLLVNPATEPDAGTANSQGTHLSLVSPCDINEDQRLSVRADVLALLISCGGQKIADTAQFSASCVPFQPV
jgi:hypothetical protein